MLASIFDAFGSASPVSVMMRGLLERVFAPESLDGIFATHAKVQYARELLFSSVVNLLSLVVCGVHPSVNAAYKAKAADVNVTRAALYQKLNGVEIGVSAALLRETAGELSALIARSGGGQGDLLPGYAVRILDGNALAATEHRLKVLRDEAAAPLPGKSLVVLDPATRLAVDIFPCEDGHAQERRLFNQVLATVQPQQLWIADRNMCTQGFLLGIDQREAAFVIREHQGLPWQPLSELKLVATVASGELFEQSIQIEQDGHCLTLRRVVLRLLKPTRHNEREMAFLTNLPTTDASAVMVSQLYRERWQIETLFLTVTMNFEGEIKTLAYPQAALFSFSLALVTYNILATIRAILASVHGVETINQTLSDFYLVDEIQGTYRGMMIAIPAEHWQTWGQMSSLDFTAQLKILAANVNLKRFLKQPRKKKTPSPKRVIDPKKPHVSTAKLLSPD
jgi:Transposase DDE domain